MLCVPHQESGFVRTRLEGGPMRRIGTVEHFEGADVDLMAALADSLGVSLEIRPAIGSAGMPSYDALIPALLDGAGDLIASSLSITPRRAEKVAFSRPYYTNHQVVVARSASALDGIPDLQGLTPATVRGSSQHERLLSLGFGEASLFPSAFAFESYMAVADGQADFTIVDSSSATRVLSRFPELASVLEVAFVLPGDDYYGVAVRPGSDLLGAVNELLSTMQSSGRLASILERHLGAVPGS
jgi:ABC-type amino acid transport substrate-binding protein